MLHHGKCRIPHFWEPDFYYGVKKFCLDLEQSSLYLCLLSVPTLCRCNAKQVVLHMYLTEYIKTLLEESNNRIIESKIDLDNYPIHFLLHYTFTSTFCQSNIVHFTPMCFIYLFSCFTASAPK